MKSLDAVVSIYVIVALSVSYCQGGYETTWQRASAGSTNPSSTTVSRLDIYQRTGESNYDYYRRILAQHAYETSSDYSVRVEILKALLPDLPVWEYDTYVMYSSIDTDSAEPTVNQQYLSDIEKTFTETTSAYYERIFEKHKDEYIDEYIRRVCKLKTILSYSSTASWPDNFIRYVKPYLSPYVKTSQQSSRVQPSSPTSFSSVDSNFPSSPNNPSSPATPDATNTLSSPQTAATTSSTTVQSPNSLPAGSPTSHTKRKFKEGKQNLQQQGESNEAYCKRLFQSDAPLPKKEYKKILKKLKKVLEHKSYKQVKNVCKEFLLQQPVLPPAPSSLQSLSLQPV